jgi:hypothetical protein
VAGDAFVPRRETSAAVPVVCPASVSARRTEGETPSGAGKMPALPFGLPRANHLAVTVLERAQFAIRGSRKRFFPLAAIIAIELPVSPHIVV